MWIATPTRALDEVLAEPVTSAGDTAWVLTAAALVLFMTPGLALFYAGMVNRRNTLVMLQQNIVPIGVITVTWILIGYSLAFGSSQGGVIGSLELFGLHEIGDVPPDNPRHIVDAATGMAVPTLAFVAYQMMFAIITPALATGAVAGRLKAFGWIVFLAAWSIVVYPPIAHWLWNPDGWAAELGAQDWAGGMVVHAAAGAAVVALLIVLGRRQVYPDREPLPHSIPLVIVGAGILWFGWFGFNGADGLRADGLAAQAMLNTQVAGAAALLVWLAVEYATTGKATVLGAVTGGVAGLATVTPAAGYVSTLSAMIIGVLAGFVCHLALRLKEVFKYDDALDVIAVHFVGGVLGTLLVGFFGSEAINASGRDGLFLGGGGGLLGAQAVTLLAVIGYSFVVTLVIALAIQYTIGLRVRPEDEEDLDQVQQGASAYNDAPVTAGALPADEPTSSPADLSGDMVQVTALLSSHVPVDALAARLKAAGAASVVVAKALTYGAPDLVRVRSGVREVTLPTRNRAEVLAPVSVREAVLQTLRDAGASQIIAQPVVVEDHG